MRRSVHLFGHSHVYGPMMQFFFLHTKQMDKVTTAADRNILRNPLVAINSNSVIIYMFGPSSHQCMQLKTVLCPNIRKCSFLFTVMNRFV
jgi:hypothetical protein